jgi:C4-dicarboxylate-specific signal transduction histidine kinase
LNHIQLRFAQAQRLSPVLGNRSLLQQIVVNLCLNARDAVEATHIAAPRIDIELDDVPVSGTIVQAHVLDPPARCVRLTQ